MKVVQLNCTCGMGSTGKICISISELMSECFIENYVLYTIGDSPYPLGIKYSNERYIKIQALKARLLGNWGFNSKSATKKLIRELERIDPDIVHIHNIHGHDCDLRMLLHFLHDKQIRVLKNCARRITRYLT